ncbi:MAG: hypothetical protein NVS9B14_22290 [Candidatus Acidiferrum sp.]
MRFRPLLIAAALCCAPRAVNAQDFFQSTASARSNGLGGAYVASSSDAIDAIATNPAGLSYLRGRNLNLSADAVFARGSFSNSVNSGAPLQNPRE